MPWIKESDCVACGLCVDNCPVKAISMIEKKAIIEFEKCIRCGRCHDICPRDAVRHDGERVPEEVEENIDWVNNLMENYSTEDEKNAFIQRMKNFFNKEKKVIAETLDRLESY
ncbi:MAG: 4Fe-4S binding protein [Halanaerobiales bacterium]|nr:4Fe-4S binding protein [Halanaerobiales bacterium]HKL43528.1 4Fe-4S binding protein [Clostridia bacterium]